MDFFSTPLITWDEETPLFDEAMQKLYNEMLNSVMRVELASLESRNEA